MHYSLPQFEVLGIRQLHCDDDLGLFVTENFTFPIPGASREAGRWVSYGFGELDKFPIYKHHIDARGAIV